MLSYVITDERGQGDRLIAEVAERLSQAGVPLAGAVQFNRPGRPDRAVAMDLRMLPDGPEIRISQDLGAGASGCRLDPDGLERAVGLTERAMTQGRPALLIVNKFGKQEIAGRGFRPLIGAAIADGLPVMVGVHARNLPGFEAFAEGLGTRLPVDAAAMLAWCAEQLGDAVPPYRVTLPVTAAS